ncbi:MAG TPA: hypothetical protein VF952_00700 [Chloroflexia bacterium]|jgi:hypothetical protein
MCDFGSNPQAQSVDSALSDFDALIERLDPGVQHIHIAPGGSFLSDQEVPPELRRGVMQRVERLRFLRSVGIETRPNLLTKRKLLELINSLPTQVQHLTVGFGFECLTDIVREVSIYKGYGRSHVEAAIRVINAVNADQAHLDITFEVYVMLKPLFLSEQEAIDEALRTIDWCYAAGAETAVLFLNTIKRNTIQAYMAERADLMPPLHYQPPYYRSAIQVLRQLTPTQRQRTAVLGVQSGVLADGMPRGCPLCTPFLLGALMAHNFTRDPSILDHAANSICPCRDAWLEDLLVPGEDLRSRIYHGLEILEQAFSK